MARTLKDTDGFIFHGWMRNRLGLTGGELFAYALVHQFSQSNAGRYLGGPGYLSAWLGCSDNTARKYLHSLVEKGLLVNKDREENGVTFRDYVVSYDPLQNFGTPSKNLGTPLKNFWGENNIDNNTPNGVNNYNNPLPPKKFNFRKALLGLGVTDEVADAWMQVRKEKKAVNTEIAFREIVRQIVASGRTANECIYIAVKESWRGFKAEWLKEHKAQPQAPSRSAAPRPNTTESLLDLGAEMFGRQNTPCDEQ